VIRQIYSSALTVDSPTYYRDCNIPNYHYESIQVNVVTTGLYTIWSNSSVDTYGYIYKENFDSLKPVENLLSQHSGSCNQGQFKLIIALEAYTTYILVVTTYRPSITGNFSIFVSGPDNVTLNPISESLYYFVNNNGKTQNMFVYIAPKLNSQKDLKNPIVKIANNIYNNYFFTILHSYCQCLSYLYMFVLYSNVYTHFKSEDGQFPF
jgi:hypothetical protein